MNIENMSYDDDIPDIPDIDIKLPGQGYNTGPKGVLTDYHEAKKKLILKIEREKKETWQLLNKYSFTTTTVQEDEERAKQILEKDEFNHKPSQPNKTKNQYGQLYHIEKLDLVDFVDNEKDKDVVIIIHVFRPYIRPCVRLNDILEEFAEDFKHIKFASMEEIELRTFDDDSLPIVIKYVNGEVVKSLIKITDELGYDFDYDDVLSYFRREKLM